MLTTGEKELLGSDEADHNIFTALEDVEKETLIELDTMEFIKGSIFEARDLPSTDIMSEGTGSSGFITNFVLSGACLLYLIMFVRY